MSRVGGGVPGRNGCSLLLRVVLARRSMVSLLSCMWISMRRGLLEGRWDELTDGGLGRKYANIINRTTTGLTTTLATKIADLLNLSSSEGIVEIMVRGVSPSLI